MRPYPAGDWFGSEGWVIRFHDGMMTCLRFDVEDLTWKRDSQTFRQPGTWQVMAGCY